MLSTDGSMVMILWSVKYRQKTVRMFSGNKKPTMERCGICELIVCTYDTAVNCDHASDGGNVGDVCVKE